MSAVRTEGWCEAHNGMAEDVQQVLLPSGALRPVWGTHACRTCRQRLGMKAAPRKLRTPLKPEHLR